MLRSQGVLALLFATTLPFFLPCARSSLVVIYYCLIYIACVVHSPGCPCASVKTTSLDPPVLPLSFQLSVLSRIQFANLLNIGIEKSAESTVEYKTGSYMYSALVPVLSVATVRYYCNL